MLLKLCNYNQGSNTLIKTLNNNKFNTYLITGGFKPISTYVGERLEFQNIISNEFEFENDNTFKGFYVPIAGEKNSKLEFIINYLLKRILNLRIL